MPKVWELICTGVSNPSVCEEHKSKSRQEHIACFALLWFSCEINNFPYHRNGLLIKFCNT